MRSRRGLGCLAVLLVGTGCGRLGFEPAEPVSEEPLPIHRDAGSDAQLDDAGSVLAEADAGDAPSNGKPRGPDPVDAGVPGDVDASVSPGSGDAGGATVEDAGTLSDSLFSCADFPGALACATFDEPLSSDWYLSSHHGEYPVLHDGYLDTQTYNAGADSYASVSFGPFYSGTIYFRMRVMFPSDGDLSSVNFITVGDYSDESDYGVELDAIDGRLSFNSSTDGFIDSDFVLARDRWLCIDARIVLDGASGEMSARVDGQTAFAVTNVDTVPNAGTTLVDVGIDWTRTPEDYGHVLVDEFVISRDPVTCP